MALVAGVTLSRVVEKRKGERFRGPGRQGMAIFVNLAPESRVALIRCNGISRLRKAVGEAPGGFFAMPVTRNFYLSHQ